MLTARIRVHSALFSIKTVPSSFFSRLLLYMKHAVYRLIEQYQQQSSDLPTVFACLAIQRLVTRLYGLHNKSTLPHYRATYRALGPSLYTSLLFVNHLPRHNVYERLMEELLGKRLWGGWSFVWRSFSLGSWWW